MLRYSTSQLDNSKYVAKDGRKDRLNQKKRRDYAIVYIRLLAVSTAHYFALQLYPRVP